MGWAGSATDWGGRSVSCTNRIETSGEKRAKEEVENCLKSSLRPVVSWDTRENARFAELDSEIRENKVFSVEWVSSAATEHDQSITPAESLEYAGRVRSRIRSVLEVYYRVPYAALGHR